MLAEAHTMAISSKQMPPQTTPILSLVGASDFSA